MDANFEFHEKWKNPETGRYKTHVYLMDGKQMTGVTTVLGVIAKPSLIQWAADMACEYIRNNSNRDVAFPYDKDSEPELGDYIVKESTIEEARVAHCKKKEAAGTQGTDTHAEVEKYVKECINVGTFLIDSDETVNGITGSRGLAMFSKWAYDNNVRFLASEKKVYSKEWFVAGTFDFSFEKDGKRFIGDLKTMGKIWDRVPFFQTAAYRKMSIEMGEAHYDGSCIVNISKPSEKYPSVLTDAWSYDFEGDQKAFEAALTLYRQLNTF